MYTYPADQHIMCLLHMYMYVHNNNYNCSVMQKEWRGMHIGVLHQRIRRLSVMMELTEPGLIPDAALLASLISVVSSIFRLMKTYVY